MTPIPWMYDDAVNGRYYDSDFWKSLGVKRPSGDCTVRALAIVNEMSYEDAFCLLDEECSRERPTARRPQSDPSTGIYTPTLKRAFGKLGMEWVPCMGIGTGCQVHMREEELPRDGWLIVSLSRHLTAVVHGTCYDLNDPSRDGNRCVYGFWRKP